MFSKLHYNSRSRPSSYLAACPITVRQDHQLRRTRLPAENIAHKWFTLQVTEHSFQRLFVALTRSSHASAEFPCSYTQVWSVERQVVESRDCPSELRGIVLRHLLSLLPGNPILIIFGCNGCAYRVRVDESPLFQKDFAVFWVSTPHVAIPLTLNASAQKLQSILCVLNIRPLDVILLFDGLSDPNKVFRRPSN